MRAWADQDVAWIDRGVIQEADDASVLMDDVGGGFAGRNGADDAGLGH